MGPQLKLALAVGMVVIAITFSLVMFPRLSSQVEEMRVSQTATARALSITPTPSATAAQPPGP